MLKYGYVNRNVFGANVGPKCGTAGDTLQYYEGIQVRGHPTSAPAPTPLPLPASPILKAQLSAPTPAKTKVSVVFHIITVKHISILYSANTTTELLFWNPVPWHILLHNIFVVTS